MTRENRPRDELSAWLENGFQSEAKKEQAKKKNQWKEQAWCIAFQQAMRFEKARHWVAGPHLNRLEKCNIPGPDQILNETQKPQ